MSDRFPTVHPKTISLRGIQLRGKGPKFQRFLGKQVRIWSREWGAWWRPNGAGYTAHVEQAGVYLFEDAIARTYACGPEKRIYYRMV